MPDDMTQVWWRQDGLNPQERTLMDAILRAHHNSAYRNNPSSLAAAQSADGSGDLASAICSAILATGGRHAPIVKTSYFLLLDEPHHEVFRILKHGNKVPGWGGTYQKEAPDPIWDEVSNLLRDGWPEMSARLAAVTTALHSHGKMIYPNPSAYTAAAGIVLGLGPKFASYLFILGRLTAWTQIAAQQMQEQKEK